MPAQTQNTWLTFGIGIFAFLHDGKESPTYLRARCSYSKAEFYVEAWRCDTLGGDFS